MIETYTEKTENMIKEEMQKKLISSTYSAVKMNVLRT